MKRVKFWEGSNKMVKNMGFRVRSRFKLDSITYALPDFGYVIISLHLNFVHYEIGKKYTSFRLV